MPIGDYVAWTHAESISQTFTPGPSETQMSFNYPITVPAMALTGTAPGFFSMAVWKVRRVPESATITNFNIENGSTNDSITISGDTKGWQSGGTFGQAANPNVNNVRSHTTIYKRDANLVNGGTYTIGTQQWTGDPLTFPVTATYPVEWRGIVILALLHDLDGLTEQPRSDLPFPQSNDFSPRLSWSYPESLSSPVFTSGVIPINAFHIYDPGPTIPHIIYNLSDSGDGGGLPPLNTLDDADDGWGNIVRHRDFDFQILMGLAMPNRTLPHPSGITPGNTVTTQGGRATTNNIPVSAAPPGRVMVVG